MIKQHGALAGAAGYEVEIYDEDFAKKKFRLRDLNCCPIANQPDFETNSVIDLE